MKNTQALLKFGVTIPTGAMSQVYLMTFLSAKATPIARQLEIWLPDEKREYLVFSNGFSEKNTNLADLYAGKTVAKGEGVMGRVWLTGMPSINEKYEDNFF
jgi:hypothetical protein